MITRGVGAALAAAALFAAPAHAAMGNWEYGELSYLVDFGRDVTWTDQTGIAFSGRATIMRHLGVRDVWMSDSDLEAVRKALESLGWKVDKVKLEEEDGSKIYQMKRPVKSAARASRSGGK